MGMRTECTCQLKSRPATAERLSIEPSQLITLINRKLKLLIHFFLIPCEMMNPSNQCDDTERSGNED